MTALRRVRLTRTIVWTVYLTGLVILIALTGLHDPGAPTP